MIMWQTWLSNLCIFPPLPTGLWSWWLSPNSTAVWWYCMEERVADKGLQHLSWCSWKCVHIPCSVSANWGKPRVFPIFPLRWAHHCRVFKFVLPCPICVCYVTVKMGTTILLCPQDLKHLHRACKFAEWCMDYGKHQYRTPDRPLSLFESMRQAIYLNSEYMMSIFP